MRIALAGEGTRGDLHPLLAAGGSLAALGHDVVVCAPPDFEATVEEHGLAFRAVGLDVRAALEREARALTLGGAALVGALRRHVPASLRAQFEQLPAATRGADLVVAGGVQVAAASAAELCGAAYRYVAYCPMLLPSAAHPPPLVRSQAWPAWANRLAWRLNRSVYDRVLGRALNRERAALGLPPVADVFAHLLGTRPVLAVDAELAGVPADCPHPVVQTRCLHPLGGDPLPPKLESFLETGPRPVFFGFGSMPDPRPERTTREIVAALERLGCRAVLSAGWAGLGDGPLPGHVFAAGPVSHARLFPRVAAVVHHGGAGTTTTAARAGVPQLIVPHVLDQFYWAARVHALGVAPPPLPRRALRAGRLADALEATLANELLADRARDLGERLRARAAAEPDPALALLPGA